MCGILGWLGKHLDGDLLRFGSALDLLAHRGPNDRGVWHEPGVLLGHRRLSILDLSAAGHQPMQDSVTGSVLTFNGEIYNYLELAKELERLGHRFKSQSDTEVLLHALIEWGAAALPRLNGMWAFAFWSPQRGQLLLSRDRFGVKPLYYLNGKQGLAFASEPKALLSLFPEHRKVNETSLLDFLGNNALYTRGASFYRGIELLPAAHYAIYEPANKSLRLKKYWDYPADVDENLTEAEAVEQFASLFTDVVRLRLRSDVPLGVTLSGGLDSTGVLAAAVWDSNSSLTCFTSVYSDSTKGEFNWAKLASKAGGCPLVAVDAPQNEWLETLRKIVWHMDGPGYSPAVYPLWNLMKEARSRGVPVLLEGQGADEALAGYTQYGVLDLLAYVQGKSRGDARSVSAIFNRFAGLSRTFSLRLTLATMARELSPALLNWQRRRVGFRSLMLPGIEIPELLVSAKSEGDPARTRLREDHAINILPGLLHYGDSVSMAHGIEARNPFLDYRLVEWMFRLPAKIRFNHGEAKWVLREYLRHHGQEEIGNRPDKKGYPTPVGQWLAAGQGEEIEKLLLEKNSPILQWCDGKKIKNLLDQNRKGTFAAEHHLYKLVSTQLWLQECIGV